ncbi:Uncharacterised protein [Pasteurella multocida]|nr:Uncharacterised protein [Pasteurella multocida]
MDKNKFLSKINEISLKSKYIKTYHSDVVNVMKGIGRITGETDKQYIEFLKLTNGMSILDYCFWGIKNSRLYPKNIYDEILYLWSKHNLTSLYFWCVAGNSEGEYFGYIPIKDDKGNHFIAYFNESHPEQLIILSSSFEKFLESFFSVISTSLNKDCDLLNIDYRKLFCNENYHAPYLIDYLNKNPREIDLLHVHKKN